VTSLTEHDRWEACARLHDRIAAEIVRGRLAVDGVPAQIERIGFDDATAIFDVIVPRALAHRARWILAQSPPTDEELDYLATGELPGQDHAE
jgi:hypothetical protein